MSFRYLFTILTVFEIQCSDNTVLNALKLGVQTFIQLQKICVIIVVEPFMQHSFDCSITMYYVTLVNYSRLFNIYDDIFFFPLIINMLRTLNFTLSVKTLNPYNTYIYRLFLMK